MHMYTYCEMGDFIFYIPVHVIIFSQSRNYTSRLSATQYLIQLFESLEDGLDPERRTHNVDQLEVERVAMEED